jgi:hypothetical protein
VRELAAGSRVETSRGKARGHGQQYVSYLLEWRIVGSEIIGWVPINALTGEVE